MRFSFPNRDNYMNVELGPGLGCGVCGVEFVEDDWTTSADGRVYDHRSCRGADNG